jgi:Serine/threonine protein phosphatase
MRFSIYQESRKGGRPVNQDRMGYLYTRRSLLMMVADGMGGHARGEVAAELTLQKMAAIYQRDARPLLPDPAAFFEQSIQAAHRELHRYRAENRLPEAPRTTIVACVVQDGIPHLGPMSAIRACTCCGGGAIAHRTADHSRGAAAARRRARSSRMMPTTTRTATASSTASAPTRRRRSRFRPTWRCVRATRCCCAPTACGADSPMPTSCRHFAAPP